MTQVSRYPISKEVYERCWEIFVKTLIGIHNVKDAEIVINDLLTPTERIMLVKRLATALLLMQGYEYREISKVLRVSLPTISAVNRSLRYGSNGYNKALSKILKDEQFAEFLNKMIQGIIALPARGGIGSGTYRYLRQELQKRSKDRKAF
ncbi:hypothetical protein HYS94_02635 [Candidatus Daviesbacteria bacterium]|nr:hypothetical protein [Candidatus Daviesbacteria bacterium]